MSRKEHRYHWGIISDYHTFTDGEHTGYGSSRRLAERALEEAQKTDRDYVEWTDYPSDLVFGAKYGEKIDRSKKTKAPTSSETSASEPTRNTSGGDLIGWDTSGGDLIGWVVGIGVAILLLHAYAPKVLKGTEFVLGLAIMATVGAVAWLIIRTIYKKAGVVGIFVAVGAIIVAGLWLYSPTNDAARKEEQLPSHRPLVPPPAPPKQKKMVFTQLGPQTVPSATPTPVFLGKEPTNGWSIFSWRGGQWKLPPPPPNTHYHYLCDVKGRLMWCSLNPPNVSARPCTRNTDGLKGWCWEEYH
jgi:hypothetical protein